MVRIERLLVGLLGHQEFVRGFLIVELGQAEHHVGRPLAIRGVLVQEALEHGDGIHAPPFLFLFIASNLRLVLGPDGLDLVGVGALDDAAGGTTIVFDRFGEAGHVLRELIEDPRVGHRCRPRAGGKPARGPGAARKQDQRQQGRAAQEAPWRGPRTQSHFSSSSKE